MAACKDHAKDPMTIHPIDHISRAKGLKSKHKKDFQFLVHWINQKEPTWEPWSNVSKTYALYNFLKEQTNPKLLNIIPKDISYEDSDDENEEEDLA